MAEHQDHRGSTADPGGEPPFGPRWYGEQDENGVDLSMIRELLRLTPAERLRRADRARRDALRLLEYGRRHRQRNTA